MAEDQLDVNMFWGFLHQIPVQSHCLVLLFDFTDFSLLYGGKILVLLLVIRLLKFKSSSYRKSNVFY